MCLVCNKFLFIPKCSNKLKDNMYNNILLFYLFSYLLDIAVYLNRNLSDVLSVPEGVIFRPTLVDYSPSTINNRN